MASRQPGPFTEIVRTNLRRIRDAQGLSLRDLSSRLSELGHPLVPSGIGRIETGDRRVDVDDLIALALALRVSPLQLLLPNEARIDSRLSLAPNVTATTRSAWWWARGVHPNRTAAVEGVGDLPDWAFEHCELPTDKQRAPAELRQLVEVIQTSRTFGAEAEDVVAMYRSSLERSIAATEASVEKEQEYLAHRDRFGLGRGLTEDPSGRRVVEAVLDRVRALLENARRRLSALRSFDDLKRQYGSEAALEMVTRSKGATDG